MARGEFFYKEFATHSNTQPKMNNLVLADEDSIEQCFAANIVQCCQQY